MELLVSDMWEVSIYGIAWDGAFMELLNSCSEGLEMLEALNVADTSQIGEKKKKMKKWNQIKKILNLYPFKII